MRIRFPTVEMFVTRPVLSVITDTSMFGFSCDRVIGLELAPPPVKVIPRKTNLPDTESKPHAEARTSLPTLVRLIEAVMYSGIISHSFGLRDCKDLFVFSAVCVVILHGDGHNICSRRLYVHSDGRFVLPTVRVVVLYSNIDWIV